MNGPAPRRAQLIIGVVGIVVMGISAATIPEIRYPSLLFMLLGIILMWRVRLSARATRI